MMLCWTHLPDRVYLAFSTNCRYKYINTKWVNIGKAEAHCEEMLKYIHPESPSTGKHWMASKISFKKIKVTNNKNHKKGLVSISIEALSM